MTFFVLLAAAAPARLISTRSLFPTRRFLRMMAVVAMRTVHMGNGIQEVLVMIVTAVGTVHMASRFCILCP